MTVYNGAFPAIKYHPAKMLCNSIVIMRKNYTALECIGMCLLLEMSRRVVQVVW